MTEPKDVVDDIEWGLDFPLGRHIRRLLEVLIERLDERYK